MRHLLLLLIFSIPRVYADWLVDESTSHIGFASIKNEIIAENHSFTRVSGAVTDAGAATIVITLASVETLIPIRNERMQSMLFETMQFPVATVTSQLQMSDFLSMSAGGSKEVQVDMKINMHGIDLEKTVPAKVTRSGADSFEVTSLGPILVHASQFALAEGVEALREIAGLQSIDLMVPVTFNLTLVEAKSS